MYKYQLHLTRHQKYINNVHVMLFFRRQPGIHFTIESKPFISMDEIDEWFDNHENEMHEMMIALG